MQPVVSSTNSNNTLYSQSQASTITCPHCNLIGHVRITSSKCPKNPRNLYTEQNGSNIDDIVASILTPECECCENDHNSPRYALCKLHPNNIGLTKNPKHVNVVALLICVPPIVFVPKINDLLKIRKLIKQTP